MLPESPQNKSEKLSLNNAPEYKVDLDNLDDWEKGIFDKIQKQKDKSVTLVYRGDNPLLMNMGAIYDQAGYEVRTIKFEPDFDPDRCGMNGLRRMYMEISKIENDYPNVITDTTMNTVVETYSKKIAVDAFRGLYSTNIDHFVNRYKPIIEKFKDQYPILLEWKISDHMGFSGFPMAELKYLGFDIDSRDEIDSQKIRSKISRACCGQGEEEVERRENLALLKVNNMFNHAFCQIFKKYFYIPSLRITDLYALSCNDAKKVRNIIENNLPDRKDIVILHDHHAWIEKSDKFTQYCICPCHCGEIEEQDASKTTARRDALAAIDTIIR